MRTFIAIDMPAEIRKELVKIQEKLKEKIGKIARAKFVAPENLHLTLKFLGELSDFKVNKIKETLRQVKFKAFKVKLNSLGVFTEKFIRVVWINLEPAKPIMELHEKIDSLFEKKDKNFETHVTLARIKFVSDRKEFISKLKEIKVEPLEFEINSFALKKSTLTEKGPIYETIREFTSS